MNLAQHEAFLKLVWLRAIDMRNQSSCSFLDVCCDVVTSGTRREYLFPVYCDYELIGQFAELPVIDQMKIDTLSHAWCEELA
jgi:hypothetical protein